MHRTHRASIQQAHDTTHAADDGTRCAHRSRVPHSHQAERGFTLHGWTTNAWERKQSICHALHTTRRNCDC